MDLKKDLHALFASTLSNVYLDELADNTETAEASRRHYRKMSRILELPLKARFLQTPRAYRPTRCRRYTFARRLRSGFPRGDWQGISNLL